MTPVQGLARIAALLPPPRFPLLRFAGVLASRSSWRSAVVAMRPALRSANGAELSPTNTKKAKKKKASGGGATTMASPSGETPPSPSGPRTRRFDAAGIVNPCYARIDWATLLRRIYLDDVLTCPCGGRRYVVDEVNQPDAMAPRAEVEGEARAKPGRVEDLSARRSEDRFLLP